MAAERRAEEVQAQLEEQLQKLAAERARQEEQAALALMRQGQPLPSPEPEAGHSIAWAASKGTLVATNNVIALPPRARLLTLCYGAACRLHKPHLRLVAEHTECASEPARRRRGATGRARALARG